MTANTDPAKTPEMMAVSAFLIIEIIECHNYCR